MAKELLLVEDNEEDAHLTIRAFRKQLVANEIVVVGDGVAALDYLFGEGEYAGRSPSQPALILLDLNLPRIDGLEVLRRIRQDPRTKLLPVVILTSSHEDEDRLRGYALGANAYVRKPVAFAEFAEAAKTLGLFWLMLNEPPPVPAGA